MPKFTRVEAGNEEVSIIYLITGIISSMDFVRNLVE